MAVATCESGLDPTRQGDQHGQLRKLTDGGSYGLFQIAIGNVTGALTYPPGSASMSWTEAEDWLGVAVNNISHALAIYEHTGDWSDWRVCAGRLGLAR